MRNRRATAVSAGIIAVSAFTPGAGVAQLPGAESTTPLTADHYVPVVSKAPSLAGQIAQIYVRERALPGTVLRAKSLDDRVVLFVHGGGTPAEVAFDPPYPGASWMAFLASAGYDVFSVDMTGYGRSTRPSAMNDPCNLSKEQQEAFVPVLISAPCAPSYGFAATTIESDWHDVGSVVDYIRDLRGVDRVHLVGWSAGGPRAGGYTARNPEKVASVTLLSPAYNRNRASAAPDVLPVPGPTMTKQSRADFDALWDRQLGCADQYEPAVRNAVWSAMLESDPVGATWGTGVRRAPSVTSWGFNPTEVGDMDTPMLLIAPETDGQVSPDRVSELYEDLGSSRKVLIDLACSSHNAMWENNRSLMFDASLQWLRDGSVNGVANGVIRLGH